MSAKWSSVSCQDINNVFVLIYWSNCRFGRHWYLMLLCFNVWRHKIEQPLNWWPAENHLWWIFYICMSERDFGVFVNAVELVCVFFFFLNVPTSVRFVCMYEHHRRSQPGGVPWYFICTHSNNNNTSFSTAFIRISFLLFFTLHCYTNTPALIIFVICILMWAEGPFISLHHNWVISCRWQQSPVIKAARINRMLLRQILTPGALFIEKVFFLRNSTERANKWLQPKQIFYSSSLNNSG